MDDIEYLPEAVKTLQNHLGPYIKQRQEVTHIRRILGSHLNQNLSPEARPSLPQPISLLGGSCNIDSMPHGVRGLQKEYLRCARANIKARNEYTQVSSERHTTATRPTSVSEAYEDGGKDDHMNTLLGLVKQKQRHDVLCIIQDHIDLLSKKTAPTTNHLNPSLVLKDMEALPLVPSEVLTNLGSQRISGGADLKELLDSLEKSVLRAKILLSREQKLLAKFRPEQDNPVSSRASRLQALGIARNELISWIEMELSRSGESAPEEDDPQRSSSENMSKDQIDSQLAGINRQYSRYIKTRQRLVIAVTSFLDAPDGVPIHDVDDESLPKPLKEGTTHSTAHITLPYLGDLVSVSNQQKAVIQQKSHLTISLAKQLKEAEQMLDRLADESHLLLAHSLPVKSSQNRGVETLGSFGDEISNREKPDSSRRARGWTYASESTTTSTKLAILEKLEDGSAAIDSTRQTFLGLQRLLGNNLTEPTQVTGAELTETTNIWAKIDGSLGAIKLVKHDTV